MLELDGVSGGWGSTTVVREVGLSVRKGEVVVVTGRNGMGKTTLLELIAGRAERHGGAIRLSGVDIGAWPIFRRAEAGIGYVPQEREVFRSLTVRQNISIARRPGIWTEDRLFALFPSLRERADSYGWQLSGGEQQMTAIARALAGNPQLLLMDEPTEGLAPIVVQQLIAAIQQIAATGSVTLMIVEQRIDTVLKIGERCIIMERGQVVHDEPSGPLRREPHRLARLLGFESDGKIAAN